MSLTCDGWLVASIGPVPLARNVMPAMISRRVQVPPGPKASEVGSVSEVAASSSEKTIVEAAVVIVAMAKETVVRVGLIREGESG